MDVEGDADQLQRALTAAHLYYVQDRTMEAIANEMHTSRSTVSRLVAHARTTGLVEIRVRSPHDAQQLLETQVAGEFGVDAHVIPVPDDVSELERLTRVAVAAARVVVDLIESNMTVGIAWGSTVGAVSRHLVPKRVHDTTFVQLNGSGNPRTTGLLYASEIITRFAAAYRGSGQQFPVPAFFDDPMAKEALWRERSLRRILDIQARMGLIVFSVGAAHADVPSHVYSGGYLEPSDLAALETDGVVGDVATVFYRADGSTDRIALNERATGPDFDALRRVPRRFCVVSGISKTQSLRGALAAGLVTELVVDEATARALLDG